MLKLDLILQIMNKIGHFLKQKNKQVIGLMKDELGEKIMINLLDYEQKFKVT